jgi:hypothetical protein
MVVFLSSEPNTPASAVFASLEIMDDGGKGMARLFDASMARCLLPGRS